MTQLSDTAIADVVAAMGGTLSEDIWTHEDDACDCTFQRVGLWKNPYLGETLHVRWCCIWAELYRLFPQFVRVTPAYLSGEDEWQPGVREWDGESDMPRAIWYRQLRRQTGRTLPEIREAYGSMEPPKGRTRPAVEPDEDVVDPLEAAFAMIEHLAERIVALEARE